MSDLLLYTVFHLNLAYSAIEEQQRAEVIERCYWPLLRLARQSGQPVGIEASGYTLETAAALAPDWLTTLRELVQAEQIEFIGSGYAQLIAPLVPAEVNETNLRLGNQVYRDLLGVTPTIALLNEQAYSDGLPGLYRRAGYKAIIMEWNNPASQNPAWPRQWRAYPQKAAGADGTTLPLIWNNSIAFQKFQRYAHAELSLADYTDYLTEQIGDEASSRAFPLYGNDVEIFDFRPGRYHTEAKLTRHNEWQRISDLFAWLQQDSRFTLTTPSRVLAQMQSEHAGHSLRLATAACPVPVKKQPKYNLTRWAVSGRADFDINSACHQIYAALRQRAHSDEQDWRRLCYLWSSDFRTHITETRWRTYLAELTRFRRQLKVSDRPDWHLLSVPAEYTDASAHELLRIETDTVRLQLNPRRGLAIDKLWFKTCSQTSLIGTLPHGYYDDIALGADFYSGHVVFCSQGRAKVTDLNPIRAALHRSADRTIVTGKIGTPFGPVHKRYTIDHETASIGIEIVLDWQQVPPGSLRLGMITLNPAAFERKSLVYRSHNGGAVAETFPVPGQKIDHGHAVSALVSATTAVGMTTGEIELRDAEKGVRIRTHLNLAALVALISYHELPDTFFMRTAFSAGETDETSSTAPVNRQIRCHFELLPADCT